MHRSYPRVFLPLRRPLISHLRETAAFILPAPAPKLVAGPKRLLGGTGSSLSKMLCSDLASGHKRPAVSRNDCSAQLCMINQAISVVHTSTWHFTLPSLPLRAGPERCLRTCRSPSSRCRQPTEQHQLWMKSLVVLVYSSGRQLKDV